jgi:PAS domain S-box-containing protein
MPPSSNSEMIAHQRTEAALRATEARMAAILDVALDCIVTIDHEGRILDWNPAAEKTFGYTRQEALGQEMAGLIVPPALRERHRAGLARAVTTGQDVLVGRRIEITATRKGGGEFPVELAITRIATNGQPLFTGHIRDITARWQTEQRLAAQYAVARVLSESATLDEATPRILQAVCETLQWDAGTIWNVDRHAGVLRCVDIWRRAELAIEAFEARTRRTTFASGVGLPGRIWARGEPAWIPDVTRDSNFPRARFAARTGLHGAFGFPIRSGAEVLGVIEFFSREIRQPNAPVLEMFAAIGSQIGQFIERRRAEEELRRLNRDLEQRIAERTAELRASEARLRESEERLRKAFGASPANISLARLDDGKYVEVNEALLQATGFTRAEIIGRTALELGLWPNPADRDAFIAELQRDGFVRHRETIFRTRSGQLRTALLSAEIIEFNQRQHILAVSLDITARKRAEEELRKALDRERELSQLKSSFVSLVSHEFRTPLGVILSSSEILQAHLLQLTDQQRADQLQSIKESTLRMSQLIEEVLLLGKVEGGQMKFTPAPLDLRGLCVRLTDEIVSATQHRCPVRFTARKLNGKARGDEGLLRHVLTNLLSNAVKYSEAGRTVQFLVERDGREAVFQVRDRGIGIPAADLPQLFAAFHRGQNVGTVVGTGLGLVIVKRCVELHGGKIVVDSREGKGTTVTVRLSLFGKRRA